MTDKETLTHSVLWDEEAVRDDGDGWGKLVDNLRHTLEAWHTR
jgi:hypothetical protein